MNPKRKDEVTHYTQGKPDRVAVDMNAKEISSGYKDGWYTQNHK